MEQHFCKYTLCTVDIGKNEILLTNNKYKI